MPPRIKITPPAKPVTEEEIKQNQKYIDKMNEVLTKIAHSCEPPSGVSFKSSKIKQGR